MRTARLGTLWLGAVVLAFAASSLALKENDFRKCPEASFCRRLRREAPSSGLYSVDPASLTSNGQKTEFVVRHKSSGRPLQASLSLFDGSVRLTVDEAEYTAPHPQTNAPEGWNPDTDGEWTPLPAIQQPLRKRWQATDALAHGFANQVLQHQLVKGFDDHFKVQDDKITITVRFDPFEVLIVKDSIEVARINSRNMMHFEPFYPKDSGVNMFRAEWPELPSDNLWEESFGSHRDTKPFGPSAVGIDIVFPGAKALYGLPERSVSYSLPNTRGAGLEDKQPYRLFNLDVFEYETDHPHPLYGAIPTVVAATPTTGSNAGAMFLNAAEQFVDLEDVQDGKSVHFMAETGVIDLFIFTGPSPKQVSKQIADATGKPFFPPLFSIGYHQCRWNYRDERDVLEVDEKFDEHDIPMDVMWLDIEHTDNKKYMTWDKNLFPDPAGMQRKLAAKGRRMVTIVDPHIKADQGFNLFQEAQEQGLFVRKPDGSGTQEGHCWPGNSAWLDYLNPAARQYWASKFGTYDGATDSLFTWNDMNEPSVFNGPEISMWRDAQHHNGVEHREVHNMYGFYMTEATWDGHRMTHPNRRPFILSRSFFAGSQRSVAIWTGDNTAEWSHLRAAQPMILSVGIAGLPFVGADIGGFFNNPEPELLVRWYQAAAFTPFFRGHAHIETARREPWLFGDDNTRRVREAIRRRYDIMPYLYTLFRIAHEEGTPIMRSLSYEFPHDDSLVAVEATFMLGDSLLVTPVDTPSVGDVQVVLPSHARWFSFPSLKEQSNTGLQQVSAGIDEGIPVFQRGGTVVARRTRARRNTYSMMYDPMTLSIAPTAEGQAQGEIHLDDGQSMAYEQGMFSRVSFDWKDNVLKVKRVTQQNVYNSDVGVERVLVAGVLREPTSVTLTGYAGTEQRSFNYNPDTRVLEIRSVAASLDQSWSLEIKN